MLFGKAHCRCDWKMQQTAFSGVTVCSCVWDIAATSFPLGLPVYVCLRGCVCVLLFACACLCVCVRERSIRCESYQPAQIGWAKGSLLCVQSAEAMSSGATCQLTN
jgi:hypothetical protein